MADRDQRSVMCATCKWEGERRYVSLDDPIGKREGFGRCPDCGGALVHRPPKYVRGRSKLASSPAPSVTRKACVMKASGMFVVAALLTWACGTPASPTPVIAATDEAVQQAPAPAATPATVLPVPEPEPAPPAPPPPAPDPPPPAPPAPPPASPAPVPPAPPPAPQPPPHDVCGGKPCTDPPNTGDACGPRPCNDPGPVPVTPPTPVPVPPGPPPSPGDACGGVPCKDPKR